MFYQPTQISSVTALSYDSSAKSPSLTVQLIGQGFKSGGTKELFVNGSELHLVSVDTPDLDEYRIANSGLIVAKIDRKKNFPHLQFELIDAKTFQTLHASSAFDDDGPPVISPGACTYSATLDKDKNLTAITFEMPGQFFTTAFAPSVGKDKNLTIVNSAITIPQTNWEINTTPADNESWKNSYIHFDNAGKAGPVVRLGDCKPAGK
jgi:hypothetical protein